MTDLVERLKKIPVNEADWRLIEEAADEIERLRDALRECLEARCVNDSVAQATIDALELEVVELCAQLSATQYQGQDK
jgi:hypothetical protein